MSMVMSHIAWLTVRDITILLGVSEGTVHGWIREQRLTAAFFGGRIGYRISDRNLQKFLRRSTERQG